ncbi:MAG: preprotein translocase subunit YajC [Alphaproteobacteria bacterium]|nr:preprotein translocase subunit YajC [Alphaproteobacteria bacterium]
MFISTAWAQGGGGAGGGLLEAMIPLVLIFAVFYFLLIRPQQKKAKAHREMLAAVRRGDRVITGGGIYGTVTKVVNDSEVVVQIADAVKVRVARGMISEVLSKTEPVRAEKPAKAEKADKASENAKAR